MDKILVNSHLYALETRPDVGARHVHDVIFILLSIESLNRNIRIELIPWKVGLFM